VAKTSIAEATAALPWMIVLGGASGRTWSRGDDPGASVTGQ
jgi:hypothetical protein